MKALFASQGIWELVEIGYAEPANATTLAALKVAERDQLKSDRNKDAKALFFLFQSVHESVFPQIAATTKSKEAWDILKTAYQGMEKVKTAKLQMLRRDFETLSMKESDTIDSFFTRVIGLITQIRSHGENLEERRIVEKILRSLPSRFEAIVVAIEETKDLSQFIVDELSASLMSHEHRLSRGTDSSFEQAFKTQMSFGQGKGRGRANNRGHGRSQNKGKNNPTSTSGRSCNQNQDEGSSKQQAHGQRYDKSQVQCHYYKKYGHYANECRKKQNDMNSRQNANFANEEDKNPKIVLLTCNIAQHKQEDFWFLDSGCSNHMIGNIAMFANLDENVKSKVTTGTDSKISVKGKGRVSIRARNGEQMIVPEQNGVAERKNRTILDMVRSMLKAKHLPHEYRAEAVTCTVYILNRCPTNAVMNKIPEEAWSGQKQTVTHMRVFGCVAYAHVPNQLRNKLDSKGEKCVFIGYCDESKAYKLYNPSTKKLIVSRDVQFIEDEAWDGSLEKTMNVKTIVSHEEEEEGRAANNPSLVAPPPPK
eukprot:PITA_03406